MEPTLEDLFSNVIRLSSAQRELIHQEALALAGDLGDGPLIDHINQALAYEMYLRGLMGRRTATGRSRAEYLPEVPGLDIRVDRSLTGVRDVVQGQMNGSDNDVDLQVKGKELLQAIFPGGVGAVTTLPYVDQARASQDIVHKLQTEFAAHVTLFGLERKVTALAALVAEYSDAVKRSPAYVLATEVQVADDRGQRLMLEVVCRVLGMNFDSDNPVHVTNRKRVLRVLVHQMDQTRQRRSIRRRRNATDTDTGTGTGTGTDAGTGTGSSASPPTQGTDSGSGSGSSSGTPTSSSGANAG